MFEHRDRDPIKTMFKEYNQRLCQKMPSEEDLAEVEFSPKFLKDADRLIRHHDKFYYVFINTFPKRILCCILVLLMVLVMAACAIKPIREAVAEFVIETYEDLSKKPSKKKKEGAAKKYPQEIPQEFKLIAEQTAEGCLEVVYENQAGQTLIYRQYLNNGSNQGLAPQGEKYQAVILLNGLEAYYSEAEGKSRLLFSDGISLFTFTTSVPCEQETLVKIANSIK